MADDTGAPSATPQRMVPYPDRDSAPWWAAVARHEMVHQRCDDCGTWRWPPRAMCSECGSFTWSWQRVSDLGTIVSHIRTHHAFLPGFTAPYDTVFVSIDEQADIVMPGTWHGAVPPEVGMRVRVHYDDIATATATAAGTGTGTGGDERVALAGWVPATD